MRAAADLLAKFEIFQQYTAGNGSEVMGSAG
jgi:hypothetical protein